MANQRARNVPSIVETGNGPYPLGSSTFAVNFRLTKSVYYYHVTYTITMFYIIIKFILNIIRKSTWKKLTKLKSLLKQYDLRTL